MGRKKRMDVYRWPRSNVDTKFLNAKKTSTLMRMLNMGPLKYIWWCKAARKKHFGKRRNQRNETALKEPSTSHHKSWMAWMGCNGTHSAQQIVRTTKRISQNECGNQKKWRTLHLLIISITLKLVHRKAYIEMKSARDECRVKWNECDFATGGENNQTHSGCWTLEQGTLFLRII